MIPKNVKKERGNVAKIAKITEDIAESLRRVADFSKIGVRMKVSH